MHIVTNVEGNYKGKKCIYVKNVKVHKIMVNGHLNELLQNICFSSASTVYYCNARLLHTSENKHIVPTNALRLCQQIGTLISSSLQREKWQGSPHLKKHIWVRLYSLNTMIKEKQLLKCCLKAHLGPTDSPHYTAGGLMAGASSNVPSVLS